MQRGKPNALLLAMGVSTAQLAKRALVSLLLALAQQYVVHIQLRREDDDSRVEAGRVSEDFTGNTDCCETAEYIADTTNMDSMTGVGL